MTLLRRSGVFSWVAAHACEYTAAGLSSMAYLEALDFASNCQIRESIARLKRRPALCNMGKMTQGCSVWRRRQHLQISETAYTLPCGVRVSVCQEQLQFE